MICPICHKKEANQTVTRRFGGAIIQGEVCDDCNSITLSMSEAEFYKVFITRPTKKCRFCGRTLNEIENSLLVGCQNCYSQFSEELRPLINRLQGIDENDN